MLRLIIVALLVAPLADLQVARDQPDTQPASKRKTQEDFSAVTPAAVIDVRDGDTIVVESRRGRIEVNFFGLQPRRGEGQAASHSFLEKLLLGEEVYLKYERPAFAEAEPRRAYVFRAPDGLFVNAELIRQGYAAMDASTDSRYREQLEDCERRARTAAKGVWSILAEAPAATHPATPAATSQPAASQPAVAASQPAGNSPSTGASNSPVVYVAKSGSKYHRPTCSFVKRGATAISLHDALERKLTPCTRCKP